MSACARVDTGIIEIWSVNGTAITISGDSLVYEDHLLFITAEDRHGHTCQTSLIPFQVDPHGT